MRGRFPFAAAVTWFAVAAQAAGPEEVDRPDSAPSQQRRREPGVARREAVQRMADELAQVERLSRDLSLRWADVSSAYLTATSKYQSAKALFDRAKSINGESAATLDAARLQLDAAARSWRFYQSLVGLAAQIDGNNMDVFRLAGLSAGGTVAESCGRLTAKEVQRLLVQTGVDLLRKRIDSSAAASASRRDNLQRLESPLGGIFATTWTPDKCKVVGVQCASAIAILRACGWLG